MKSIGSMVVRRVLPADRLRVAREAVIELASEVIVVAVEIEVQAVLRALVPNRRLLSLSAAVS